MTRRLLLSVLAVVFSAAWAFSDTDSYIQLTRVSLTEGNVGYQRAADVADGDFTTDVDWDAVSVNMPLEPGDRIYTGSAGRSEIEFESGALLWLDQNTDIEITRLDDGFVQIRMLLGRIELRLDGRGEFEIDTPAAAFNTAKNGRYRFLVTDDGRSDAGVRQGTLEATSNNFMRQIKSGDYMRVYPDAPGPEVTAYNWRDAWDTWTERREADRKSYVRSNYIPDTVYVGAVELERHGRWIYVANYGWGWAPYSVSVSWTPYSVGRWVYRSRFGWTWVSYESWGWLPYHYGRWYRDARAGWCWFPGDRISFGFWSPGLVAFYRGSGWVSWGPLGPGDYYDVRFYRYRRSYAHHLDHVRALSRRPAGDFINRTVRGAFRTVDLDHFRGGKLSVRKGYRDNIAQPWKQGELVRGRLDITPVRDSFRVAPERRGARSQIARNRAVVTRAAPERRLDAGRDTRRNHTQIVPAPDGNRGGENQRKNARAGSTSFQDARNSRQVNRERARSMERSRDASSATRNRREASRTESGHVTANAFSDASADSSASEQRTRQRASRENWRRHTTDTNNSSIDAARSSAFSSSSSSSRRSARRQRESVGRQRESVGRQRESVESVAVISDAQNDARDDRRDANSATRQSRNVARPRDSERQESASRREASENASSSSSRSSRSFSNRPSVNRSSSNRSSANRSTSGNATISRSPSGSRSGGGQARSGSSSRGGHGGSARSAGSGRRR